MTHVASSKHRLPHNLTGPSHIEFGSSSMSATQGRIRYGTGKPGIKGMTDAIDAGEFPPINDRTKKIVPLALIASSLFSMLLLCAVAGLVTLAAVYLIPQPGFLDASQDLQWAKQVPWLSTHGAHRRTVASIYDFSSYIYYYFCSHTCQRWAQQITFC